MKCALLIFYAAGIYAAPFWVLDKDLPTTELKDIGCKANRFQQGQTYVYDYDGETLNNIEGASKQSTGIKLRARILITPLAECRFAMTINGGELLSKSKNGDFQTTPESNKFQKELEQNELYFIMTDNKIISLQAAKDEATHILNIKRGMLTTFQLNEDSTTETDVNGQCEMVLTKENGQIVKTKNLSECTKRAVNEIGIQTATMKTETTMKPLNSNSKCIYQMDNDMIKSVVCKETHLFRPFSAGYETPSGAMTTVKQTLTFVKAKAPIDVALTSDIGESKSMVFDHTSEEMSATKSFSGEFDNVMKNLVKGDSLSATQQSAHEFTSLVFLLRKMDEKYMINVWQKYFDCMKSGTCGSAEYDLRDAYRQYLLDGIAYCGTSTCISMVRNVIVEGEVSGERMNMFLQSIALVGKTTKKMIADVLDIVNKQPSRQAYLTLGTLLARHCGVVPGDCAYSPSNPITKAEEFLIAKLGKSCEGQKNHERVEEIIMTLKAIGNAHRPIRARSTLISCGKNAQHSNITRAAFDAFRGMPCDRVQTDDLMSVITDINNDVEVRIHAFVAVMNCPSENVLDKVINALDREESNQLSSFMSSHLTNIMESDDIKNKDARAILEKFSKTTPIKKVDLPFYKFSKSYEKSLRIDSIKSGASVGGQIIYNNNGYFPKSGLMNFTAEVLGTQVNILEAAIAVDGLESVLANAFGPNGVLPDNFILNIFNFTYTSEKLQEMARKGEEQRTRSKRGSPGNRLTQIHDKVNMKPAPPSADFSIKVMGQEIRVFSYSDIYHMIDEIDNMNVVQLMMNIAKGGHKTFTKSMMFLEMTHAVPTGLGLPLKLKLIGSTVASVELDGKFDIRNMFWGRGSIDVNGYVKPSAVVELSGQMGIESHFIRSGMFVNSTMFVSNMVKGSVKYMEGKLFKINVDTPSEPVQLFNVSSTPFIYLNEDKTLIDGTPRRINPDFCMKSTLLGYGLCASMRLPVAFREYEAPYFPLSGPAHFGVKLIRGDEKLTTFQFLVQMTKQTTKTTGFIEFSTPGATYERKVGGKLVYTDGDNDKVLTLSTEKWGKHAEVEFGYNTVSRSSYITTKNNIFTKKDVVTTIKYFNETYTTTKHLGMLFTTEYDWYRFEHVTKYVQKQTGHMLQSSTLFYPEKKITGAIEYNTLDKKVSIKLDSEYLKQSAEVSGQWTAEGGKNGFTLTATHLTTGKTASLFGGYINQENQKDLIISFTGMGKTVTNVLGYNKLKGIRSITNVLDVNGKIARISASYDDLKADKVLAFDSDIFGRKGNSEIVIVNNEGEKSLKWIVNVGDNFALTKTGLYITPELKTLKWNADIMGRKAEVFANIHTAEGFRTKFGGVVGKYAAGVKGVYTKNHGHGQSACASVYYGTTTEEKEPVLWCFNYHTLGTKYEHNKIVLSAEHKELNKKGELQFDYEKHTGHIILSGKAVWNGKVYVKNTYEMKFNDMMNAEIKMDAEAGQYISGWKVYSQTQGKTTNVGVHAYAMDKTITFLNTFDKQVVASNTEMQLKTQLIINGKALPVTTELNLVTGEGTQEPSIKINVGKYSFAYATAVTYNTVEYSYGAEFIATRDEKSLVELFQRSGLSMKKAKELSHKFGVKAFGKTYEYGWEAAYEDQGTAAKTSHVLTVKLQYATTRKATIFFTMFNDKKQAGLMVDLEYIPGKMVSHYVKYDKKERELEVSVEFLPKMFAKFAGRLDKTTGYKLVTNYQVKWDGYDKLLKVVNNFINKRKEMTFSTSIGKKISFGLTYKRNSPKGIVLFADILNFEGKILGIFTKRNVQLRFVANKKMLLNLVGAYNKASRQITFSMENSKTKFIQIAGDYNKYLQQLKLSVGDSKNEWFQINGRYSRGDRMAVVNVFAMGKRLLKIDGSTNQKSATLNVMSLNKQLFKVIASRSKNDVSLNLSCEQIKRDITFKAEINREEMSAILSAESAGNTVGFTMRGDYKNYIMRFTGFVNKMESGWEMLLKDQALVYKMMVTPTLSGQVIFEVQEDKILKMTVQRTNGKSVVNEVTFQYTLTGEACKFMFKWNPETISKMITSVDDMIRPVVEKVMSETSKFSKKAVMISRKFLDESTTNVKQATLNFLDRMDTSFDEFDFVGVKDTVGELSLKSLRKLSQLLRKALIATAQGIEAFKANLPVWIHKTKEVTAEAKQLLKNLKVDLEKNINKINEVIYKIAKNLTESTRPIIEKAAELIQDFKFRGKPLKELVVLAKDLGQQYLDLSIEQGKILYNNLKTNGTKLYNEGKVYILKIKVPYREETVEEIIEIVMKKGTELKQKISNTDIPKMVEEIRMKVLQYNIDGKTVEQQLVVLQGHLKNLPETTKKAILEFIRLTREYSKMIQAISTKTYDQITKFAEPATNYVVFVGKTVNKHYGPLAKKSIKHIQEVISALEIPKMTALYVAKDYVIEQWKKIEKFFLPLLKPIPALYTNLVEQTRKLKVMGFSVGPLFDIQKEMLSNAAIQYMNQVELAVKEQLQLANTYAAKLSTMSPEDMVNNAYDSSLDLTNQVYIYVKNIYSERETMIRKIIKEIKSIYNKMEAKVNNVKQMSVEETMETFVHESSEKLIEYADELAGLLRQLAGMDISGPSWKAWKEADIVGHLRQYGVNGKIMNAIQAVKDVNLRKTVLRTVKEIQNYLSEVYSRAFIQVVQIYGRIENVIDYIKSIPKKEYEQWFHELEDFYRKYENDIMDLITRSYTLTRKDIIEIYNKAKTMTEVNYKTVVQTTKEYYEPAKDLYNTVYAKSVLVYNDVKQPTIDVTNHYKNIANKFVKDNYEIVYNKMMVEYKRAADMVKEKMSSLQSQMEAEYEKFLSKYGDLTWEEIGEAAYKLAEEKYEVSKQYAQQQYSENKKFALKLKKDAEELYKKYHAKALVEYNRYKQMIEEKYNEMKPKAVKMYRDYKLKAKNAYDNGLEQANKMYSDLKTNAMTIYNNNKDKTLKKIYLEIKSFIVEQIRKQYQLARDIATSKSQELKSLAEKYYAKANVLMTTIILPELKKETISFINQSLRFSVVMANETVKAYYPHYVFIKDAFNGATEIMKIELGNALEKSKVVLQKNTDKLVKVMTELLETIQNHEMYKKGMNMYNDAINHEYVKRAVAKVQELIRITKEKIEELQRHPQYLAYKKEMNKKITLYKQQLKTYKSRIEKMYNDYSKDPKVEKAQKIMKQIKKSVLYTYDQLSNKVIPQFEFAMEMMKSGWGKIPTEVEKVFKKFRQEPENAFWELVEISQSASKELYKMAVDMNMKKLKEQIKTFVTISETVSQIVMDECIDDWTKETAKQLYEDGVENIKWAQRKLKSLPRKVEKIVMKEYQEKLDTIKVWTRQQYKSLKQMWKKCPFKAFITNRIWQDVANEIMNHELVDVSKTLATLTHKQFIALKDKAIDEFTTQREFVEEKFNALKRQAINKYSEIKETAEKKYTEMIAKYNELIKKGENFVETTTIADIVASTQSKYKEAIQMIQETREKLMQTKEKYIAEANRLYIIYKAKGEKMYKELYSRAENLIKDYKNKMMPYYLKYKEQGQMVYDKYYPIAMAKYEELSEKYRSCYNKLQAKYNEVKELSMKKFEELKVKSLALYNEYRAKTIDLTLKLKRDAYSKWMDSEIRIQLLALKKMSIRETIEALKKLPKQTKEFAIATYNKYYALALKRWEAEYQRLTQLRLRYTAKLLAKRDEIIQKLEPYTVPIVDTYKWVENEIRETVLFVYKYHKLQERYTTMKDFATSEYNRVTPLIKPAIEKYSKQYKTLALKYADEYSLLAKDYSVYAKKIAKKMLGKAGHGTLRGIHSTLKYIDNIDVEAIKKDLKSKAQEYVTFVQKYISIDSAKGEFVISIPCSATPSFKHHIATVKGRVRRSVQTVQDHGKTMVARIQSEYKDLKEKANRLRQLLQQQILENTVELRADLQESMQINKKIVERVYRNSEIFAQKTYRNAVVAYKSYKAKTIELYKQAMSMSKLYYRKLMTTSKKAYLKATEMFWEMYQAGPIASYKMMIKNAAKYSQLIQQSAVTLYNDNKPIIQKKTLKFLDSMKAKALLVKKEINPYYQALKTAVLKVKDGKPINQAFQPIYKELIFASKYYQGLLDEKMADMKRQICKSDPKLCKHLKESLKVHSEIYSKYSSRALDTYTTGKARVQRIARILKNKLAKKALLMPEYLDVAMVIGDHIITFDNKMYDLPKNPGCEYLLAHDFVDKMFTLKMINNDIVIETSDLQMTINADGTTKAKYGKEVVNSLPFEHESSKCLRKHHHITCHFAEQKLRVKVNLKNFMATISMSAWHFGRTRGLLGTNNRESFDDWTLPNGKITTDVLEFVNDYELSKKQQCQLTSIKKTKCQATTPSKRCQELFLYETSPYAAYFRTVDSEMFLKTCEKETTDCNNKLPNNMKHCKAVAAFVSMARARGSWISHLPECLQHKSHGPNDEWTQTSNKKEVDIVVMVSQRKSNSLTTKSIRKVLTDLQRKFKSSNFDTRYALIGFGGEGVHEPAHIHPLGEGDDVFGGVGQLSDELKKMPMNGDNQGTNDAYHAILQASDLYFRTTSSRIFILINTEPHSAHEEGPEFDETLYALTKEADATLYVFDKFSFKTSKSIGKVIGQTTTRLYTTKYLRGELALNDEDYPVSEFTEMVRKTNGGWFTSTIRNPRQTGNALYHAINGYVKTVGELCKICRLESTYTDVPRAICYTNKQIKC